MGKSPLAPPREAIVGYSRAVRIGNLIEASGTAPIHQGQVPAPGDPYEQTRVVLRIIEEALARAGASLDDVIRTRIYVTDIRHREAVGRAHGEVFGSIRPATTMVQVAALIHPDMLVEIEATAVVDAPPHN